MNNKKIFFLTTSLLIAPAILAQTESPATDNYPYETKQVSNTSIRLMNLWMRDKSTGNQIEHFAQYPQITASMLVNDGYLYIPKFKETIPSNQQLYVYNAQTGEYLGLVDVKGLDTDKYGMRLFEDIGRFKNGSEDPFIMSGFNSRYYSEQNPEFIDDVNNQVLMFGYLDFPSPLEPTVNEAYSYKIMPNLKDRTFFKAYSLSDLKAQYSGSSTRTSDSRVFNILGSGFYDESKYTMTSSETDLKLRQNFYEERFKVDGINEAHYDESDTYSFPAEGLSNVKSKFVNYDGITIIKLLVNQSDNGSKLNNPSILYNNKNYIYSGPLSLDETAKHTGDAIAAFQLNDLWYIVYASRADEITRFRLVTFAKDKNSLDGSELLWEFPKNGFQTTDLTTESGENITAITVSKSKVNDYEVADIYLYAQGQGLAAYRVGSAEVVAGVSDLEAANENATLSLDGHQLTVSGNEAVDIYNAQGSLVLKSHAASIDLSGLQNGVYIARSGSSAYKFVLK